MTFTNVLKGHDTVVLVCCISEWEPGIACTWEGRDTKLTMLRYWKLAPYQNWKQTGGWADVREPFGYCVLQALYCACLVSKYIYLHTNKHLPSYKQNIICGQKHFAWFSSRRRNVAPKCGSDSTCEVAAGYTTGRKPLPCCDWPYVVRSKVMSSTPTRYNTCIKIKRNNSHW